MCCPFIVDVMIGVSTKAYSDSCDCAVNEWLMTLLPKQLQEHTTNICPYNCNGSVFNAVPPFQCASLVSVSAGCYKITTVFSHAQTVVLCVGCSTVLCQPTGGKARLTEGTVWAHRRDWLPVPKYKYKSIILAMLVIRRCVLSVCCFQNGFF